MKKTMKKQMCLTTGSHISYRKSTPRFYCCIYTFSDRDRITRALNALEKNPFIRFPHPSLIIAMHSYTTKTPLIDDTYTHTIAAMDLLNLYAYPNINGYSKFTIGLTVKKNFGEELSFTIGRAIPLTDYNGNILEKKEVFSRIYDTIKEYSEKYAGDLTLRLLLRVFCAVNSSKNKPDLTLEDRIQLLLDIMKDGLCEYAPIELKEIRHHNRVYDRITKEKPSFKECKPFIVADLETVMINNVHTPYAAGLMVVRPGKKIYNQYIDIYFSEDYTLILDKFEDRSNRLLSDMLNRIIVLGKKEKAPFTVYFHNFSRFDGIILINNLIVKQNIDKIYKVKPMIRNNVLYEAVVYKNNEIVMRLRDSLSLLPGTLKELAKNLCPGLGDKGDIDHSQIQLSNLEAKKEDIIKYLKQDVLLLGGIMQKAQSIFFDLFQIDILNNITLSALAMSIFRTHYYDDTKWPIYIPSKNADNFIRKGTYRFCSLLY